ncbi:MAG TPA: cache and HAMP domain-containing protein, partial [Vicinamibacterales bacterium]|nr:cache and HAMP domain-containing protein [Vicinamibacterales bacterium]
MATTPLRRRLFALTAAGILPLAVMAGISLYALQRQQREQVERVGVELARSVANAVDAELRSTVAILQTLATTPTLDTTDLRAFRERAGRVLAGRPAWSAILLSDASGTPLVDTRVGPGIALAPLADRESFDRTLKTRSPVIGLLKPHPQSGWLFAVRVPVVRAGAMRYVLTALITPDAVRDVLTRQQLPGDWIISIIDANGLRVARSRAHEETLGGRLSESGQRVLAGGGSEGFGISYTLEGERIFTTFNRLASSGWAAVLGLPTARAEAAALGALTLYGGGILLSLGLGTLAAIWVARTITGPIAQLRAAAETVGRRRIPKPPETSIQEIREVGAALNAAAMDLAHGEAERDDLLRKERRAREAAESA